MTKQTTLVYEVEYVDDWKARHISFVRSMEEVRFLQRRFDNVVFTVLTQKNFEVDNFENF